MPDASIDIADITRAWSSGAAATGTPTAKLSAPSGDRLVNADSDAPAKKADATDAQIAVLPNEAPQKAVEPSAQVREAGTASPSSTFEAPRLPDVPPDRPVRASSTLPARLIVGFKTGVVRTSAVGGVHARAGASVVGAIPQLNADVVQFSDRTTAQARLQLYQADSAVEFAEMDELVFASEVPNDPR